MIISSAFRTECRFLCYRAQNDYSTEDNGNERKSQARERGSKMTKIIMVVLVAIALIGTNNAFAYWKTSAGLEIRDPAPCPFDNNGY